MNGLAQLAVPKRIDTHTARPPIASRRGIGTAPSKGTDSAAALDSGLEQLRMARNFAPEGLDSGADHLHLLASMALEVEARLAPAVWAARSQSLSWAQIADLLGVTRAAAWQRWAKQIDARVERPPADRPVSIS